MNGKVNGNYLECEQKANANRNTAFVQLNMLPGCCLINHIIMTMCNFPTETSNATACNHNTDELYTLHNQW